MSDDEQKPLDADDQTSDDEPEEKAPAIKKKKGKKKKLEKQIKQLQRELINLQENVVAKGLRVAIIFEGRDAAGKGGVINTITEVCSPKVFKHVALPAPNPKEKTQWYYQRYVAHLPGAGEVILFDRSWYNRAGVEKVMGFCTQPQYEEFLQSTPEFETLLQRSGIILIKYWLSVSAAEQSKRFQKRIDKPNKNWKLSPMDLESHKRWNEYSRAKDAMIKATDTDTSPWWHVDADHKLKCRINLLTHLLSMLPHTPIPHEIVHLPPRDLEGGDVERIAKENLKFVPEVV